MIQVTFRAGREERVVGWTTRRVDAELFVDMLRELVAAAARERL